MFRSPEMNGCLGQPSVGLGLETLEEEPDWKHQLKEETGDRQIEAGAWHTVSLGWGGRPSSRPSVPTVVRVMPECRSDRLDGLRSEKDQKNEHRDILRPPPAGEQI